MLTPSPTFSIRLLVHLLLVLGGIYVSYAFANSGGITGQHGNAPACTGCHSGGSFIATAVINAPSVPHDALSGTFTLTGTSGTGRGFNLAIYNPSGTKVNGGFSSLSGGVQASSGELTHTATQSATSWTFTWTAPSILGTYTAYACVNPVNSNGVTSGDGPAVCSTSSFSVTNSNPNAIDDSKSNLAALSVFENSTTGTFNALSNDIQTEGDSFSWISTNQLSLIGLLTDNSSGTFDYSPDGQFESLDTGEISTTNFAYTIEEDNYSGFTDTATVTIEIKGSNDAPIANNDTITVGIGGTATTLQDGFTTSVLSNDTDVDIEPLTAVLVTDVLFGTLTLNSDGTFSYTHDGSNNLTDSFTYRANDGTTTSNLATVNIFVANTAPTAVDDLLVAIVAEGSSSLAFNVIGNDTDPETSVTAVAGISNEINGSAAIQGDQSIIFTHDGSETTSAGFQYTASDGFLTSNNSATVTLTVTPVNDPPTLAPIADTTATESIPMAVVTAMGSDPDDANDGINLVYSLINEPAGMSISNTLATIGQISWTPPQTGTFNMVYGPITVSVTDGESTPATATFSVNVSPPDGDLDGVADYDDLCVSVSDPTNADNDNDGTAGSDGGVNDGGDVCDADDDNDGMPDSFEIANGFDPFDPADAALDADGDGISNLDEYLNGTDPNIADLVFDATGYWTPVTLTPPDPTTIDPSATAVVATAVAPDDGNGPYGPYRPGRHTITWTASNAVSSNLGTVDQTLDIRPLINFAVDQVSIEGSLVTVIATLNGDPPVYPVTINYSVSGTSDAGDHDAAAGSFSITSPSLFNSFTFNVLTDGLSEADESVVFTMDSTTNAALGSHSVHTVTITEQNVAPTVDLQFQQNGLDVGSAYVSEGTINIVASVSDPNAGQTLSFDWLGTDNSLVPPTDAVTMNWSFVPVAGNYVIDLIVSDDGSPTGSTHVSRVLNITATAPTLGGIDSDGDGTNDNVEGFDDNDQDGIPNYLDPDFLDSHLMPNQTVDSSTAVLIETEPGLKLKLGSTTLASGSFNLLVTDSQIENFGSSSGGAPLNADDEFEHIGGVYDFEISGLVPGRSAQIVIPLQLSIPDAAVYRKFDPAIGWKTFVTNGQNQVASALGEPGICPEPGSSDFLPGLNFLDNCVQLTVEDGGANDADGTVNGIVKDPGAVGVNLKDPVEPVVAEGSGRVDAKFLVWLLLLAGFSFLVKIRKSI